MAAANSTSQALSARSNPNGHALALINGLSAQPAGFGWFSNPQVMGLITQESGSRMKDICGPDIDQILDKVGWQFIGAPLHKTLTNESGSAVAVGWTTLTSKGLNLSYVTATGYEGKGLAAIAIAYAILDYCEFGDYMHFPKRFPRGIDDIQIHAQFDATNHGSIRVAEKIGLQPCESLAFDVHLPDGPVKYIGSQAPFRKVIKRCIEIFEDSSGIPLESCQKEVHATHASQRPAR